MKECTLCGIELPHHPIIDTENKFCCAGCHAVFNILSSKQQLDNYQDHPLFQQAVRSGLISNPALLEQIRRKRIEVPENELEKLHLEVTDMWCPACAEVIKLILLQEKGVRNCVVDYATDLASIEFAPRYIGKERIYKLISSLGYRPATLDSMRPAVSTQLYMRFIVAAFCSLNIMMFAYPIYASYFDYEPQGYAFMFAWISLFTSLPVLTYSFWPILHRFITSCKAGLFGMETLVVIGVATAFGLSTYDLLHAGTHVYFDSMTVIIAFVLLGKIIEAKAKFSAKDSLLRLVRAIPRRGRKKLADGTCAFVLLKEAQPADLFVVVSGEKIPLDGVIIEGEGLCDESVMTGESLPVQKNKGAMVLGGSMLVNGSITFKVTSTLEGAALYRIIDMVQQNIGHKTAYVRAADHIVRWFVPLVLLIALGSAAACWLFGIADPGKTAIQTALIRAVAVLLISCPCAIGIAAPLAESYVMNGLANLGAIVRNRGCLALLGKEDVMVFDKTGTVTEGRFTVLQGLDNLDNELRGIIKGMASQSTHPISNAIANSIDQSPPKLDNIQEIAGRGLRATKDGHLFFLGSEDLMREAGVCVIRPTSLPDAIATVIYFARDKRCLACLVLGDRIRDGIKELIADLAPAKVILLSGDAETAVAAVARSCGFKSWKSGCNPLQKREYIDTLRQKGHLVCMVGDGINDAPALTAAHVGISVVSATDISIQVSDLLLTTDRLQVIPIIRTLAKRGQKIVRQNLFWAFFYNVIGLGLAAYGLLSPIFAAFAMVASSLMVLVNAVRAHRE